MKKLALSSLVFTMALTGCLKDEDFDNQEYGTQVVETRAVAFPQSPDITFGITAQVDPQSVSAPVISAEASGPATADVHVTLAVNDQLVTDLGYEVLPTTLYTIDLNAIIEAGRSFDTITVALGNTTTLDPNLIYGIGLTITSADGGYQIAANSKDIVIVFAVKNPYDGEYTSNGYFYHPTAARTIEDLPKTLATVSATAVTCDLGDLGGAGYVAIFDVNSATNEVTITPAPGAAGGAYTMFTSGLPNSNPGYTPAWPRSSECNNIWDPVEEAFKVRYGYMGANGWRVTEEVIERD